MRQSLTAAIMAVISALLSVPLFLFAIQLAVSLIKLHRGMASFAALFSMIPVAVLELAFTIGIGARYRGARGRRQLARRFLRVLAAEFALFFILETARMLFYLPVVGGRVGLYLQVRSVPSLVLAAVGLLLAAVSLALARLLPPRLVDRFGAEEAH